jgi:hypothetical protein
LKGSGGNLKSVTLIAKGEPMKRRDLIVTGLMAIAFAAAVPRTTLAAPEKAASAAQLEVTYYYIPS